MGAITVELPDLPEGFTHIEGNRFAANGNVLFPLYLSRLYPDVDQGDQERFVDHGAGAPPKYTQTMLEQARKAFSADLRRHVGFPIALTIKASRPWQLNHTQKETRDD